MATQLPISTISYNTESFLRETLDRLFKAHTICAWQYIKHTGEQGDKDHIHLRIEPNKRLDTMDLVEMFKEPVLYSDKPLGVLSFRPSKEEDWFLYAVHNEQYLAMHGNPDTEKIPYSVDNIVVSDGYMLSETFARAMAHLRHSNASVVRQLRDGVSPNSLVEQGYNPFAVSTIMRLQHRDDFDELRGKYERLANAYRDLVSLVKNKGFEVRYDEQGFMSLVPCDDFFDKLFKEDI